METRIYLLGWVFSVLICSGGASRSTSNYVVDAADPQFAGQVARTAETLRHDLALQWLGETLPNWSQPCRITVEVDSRTQPSGETSFVFDRGTVSGWRTTLRGPADRILDSVLPHEVNHAIFASYFRQPVPRWADEGGATSVEHPIGKAKHRELLLTILRAGRDVSIEEMFRLNDDPQDITAFYVKAETVTDYLIQRGGRRRYVEFLDDGLRTRHWTVALRTHYGFADLGQLQSTWSDWIAQGFPSQSPPTLARLPCRKSAASSP